MGAPLFPGFGSGQAGPPPPQPGGPILGIGSEMNMLKNILPGFLHIGKTLLGFGREPGQGYGQTVAALGSQLGEGMLKSLGTTAFTPISLLLGSNRFNRLVGAIPERLRPISVYDQFRQRGGLLPLLTEDIGNVALAAGPVGAAAGGLATAGGAAADLAETAAAAGETLTKADQIAALADQGSTAAKVAQGAKILQHPLKNALFGGGEGLPTPFGRVPSLAKGLEQTEWTDAHIVQPLKLNRFIRGQSTELAGQMRSTQRQIAQQLTPVKDSLIKLVNQGPGEKLTGTDAEALLAQAITYRGSLAESGLSMAGFGNDSGFIPTGALEKFKSLSPQLQERVSSALIHPDVTAGIDNGVGLAAQLAEQQRASMAGSRLGAIGTAGREAGEPAAAAPNAEMAARFTRGKDALIKANFLQTHGVDAYRTALGDLRDAYTGAADTYGTRIDQLSKRLGVPDLPPGAPGNPIQWQGLEGETGGFTPTVGTAKALQDELPPSAATPEQLQEHMQGSIAPVGVQSPMNVMGVSKALTMRDQLNELEQLQKLRASAEQRAENLHALASGPEEQLAPALQAARYQALGEQQIQMLTHQLEHPTAAMLKYAPEWMPLADSLSQANKIVEGMGMLGKAMNSFGLPADDVERAVESYHFTWPDIVSKLGEQGQAPVFFHNLTDAQVDRFARDSLSLGGIAGMGKQVAAGIRKERTSAFGQDQSFRSWVAGAGQVLWEQHSNNVVDWLTNHAAVPFSEQLVKDGKFVPFNPGTAVDGYQGLRDLFDGNVPDEADQMIPASVARVLRQQAKNYDFMGRGVITKITNPWRALALTLSPTWYIRHSISNLILASNAIGPWNAVKAWAETFNSLRQDIGGLHNVFTDKVAERWTTPLAGAYGEQIPTTLAPMLEGTTASHEFLKTDKLGQILPGTVAQELAQTGKLGVYHAVVGRMQNATNVLDEMARIATTKGAFERAVRAGVAPAKAAEQAVEIARKALVNYTDLGPFERSIVRTVMPFFAFQKGILKVAANLAIDHPARVGLTMLVGRINRELWDEEKQSLPDVYQSLAPLTPSVWLQTRALNPFHDVESLSTPNGILGALNPYLQIGIDWMTKSGGSPFGPKQVGPLGFAEPTVSVPGEVGDLFRRALAGGVFAPPPAGVQGLNLPQALGFATVGPDRIGILQSRMARAQQQIQQGLPLPPPEQPFTPLFGLPQFGSSSDIFGRLGRKTSDKAFSQQATRFFPATSILFRQ